MNDSAVRVKKKVRAFVVGLRLPLSVSMVVMGLLAALCAKASQNDTLSFPHALTPAFHWSESMEMQLSGIPVLIRGFVSTLTLEQAARVMASHEHQFQRVTTLPGSILLSGVYNERHWVAQLEGASGHIKGIVSTLPMDIDASSTNSGRHGFLAPWLTQNTRFVFGQSSSKQGRQVIQSIHIPNQPLEDFVGLLDLRLASAGWRRLGTHSWRGQAGGASASPRIDVFPVSIASGKGGAVFINQSE